MSFSKYTALIFHLIIFSLNAYGLKYDFDYLHKIGTSFGGRWKYLTFWSEVYFVFYISVLRSLLIIIT